MHSSSRRRASHDCAGDAGVLRPGDRRTDAQPDRFRRLQDWRLRRGIPRSVSFDHPKNRLSVDFGNVLSVDAFLAGTRDVDPVRFVEAPASEGSPVHGPDGRYAHELIVPFTLDRPSAPRTRRRRTTRSVSESRRRFAPGTEWLYANLYGPVAAADRVLVDYIGPLARRLREAGVVDRWFFIRYADPGRHLRVRFHGHPGDLLGDALPAFYEATAPALAEGLLYRISLDTYEREVERYGGCEGVELMGAGGRGRLRRGDRTARTPLQRGAAPPPDRREPRRTVSTPSLAWTSPSSAVCGLAREHVCAIGARRRHLRGQTAPTLGGS